MGNILIEYALRKKSIDLPTSVLVRRADECLMTGDRDGIVNYLRMLDSKFQLKNSAMKNAKDFREASGVAVAVKIMKRYLNDEEVFMVLIQILHIIRGDILVSTDIIQSGGVECLSKAIRDYEAHDYLSKFIPMYLDAILGRILDTIDDDG